MPMILRVFPLIWALIVIKGFMQLITLIKFKSKSDYTKMVVIAAFVVFFFNFGLQYVFGPLDWNLPKPLKMLHFGFFNDFNEYWF